MPENFLTNNARDAVDFFTGSDGTGGAIATDIPRAPRPSLAPAANGAVGNDTATQAALARAVRSMRWSQFWDKYGITVFCVGGGGALGHAFCVAQAAALVTGGPVLGHGLGMVAAPALAVATKVAADRIRPPKDHNERKQRLRGAFVMAVSGVVVAAASHLYDARYHYFLPEPPGSYGRDFKDLTRDQQDHIRHQIQSFYLPNQTSDQRKILKKQADQLQKSVEALIFDRDGLPILDLCKTIQENQSVEQRIAHFLGLD